MLTEPPVLEELPADMKTLPPEEAPAPTDNVMSPIVKKNGVHRSIRDFGRLDLKANVPPAASCEAPVVNRRVPDDALAAPEPMLRLPLESDDDAPELIITEPLAPPFAPPLAVWMSIVPELVTELYPVMIEIWPPVAAADVTPDDNVTRPPVPLLPLPTVTDIEPPRPNNAVPEPREREPLLPSKDRPVLKTMDPLVPKPPEFAV